MSDLAAIAGIRDARRRTAHDLAVAYDRYLTARNCNCRASLVLRQTIEAVLLHERGCEATTSGGNP